MIAMCAVTGNTGCSHKTVEEHRFEAQQRWNGVRARVKLQLARQLYDNEQIESCLRTLQEAVALDPLSAEVHLLLCRAWLESGKPAVARLALERAALLAPDHPEIVYMRGLMAERDGDYEQAITFYRRAGQLDPTPVDHLVSEAECLVAAGRPEEAAILVDDRIDDFDGDGTLETLRAEIALFLDDERTALTCLQVAWQAVGSIDQLAEDYGRLLLQAGRCPEAIRVLEPLYASGDREASGPTVRTLAAAYLGAGRAQDAKRVLTERVREQPDTPNDWVLLARTSLVCGDLRTARRCADEIRRLCPGDSLAQTLTAYICWKERDAVAAQAALQAALNMNPNDALAHVLMGLVCSEADELSTAQMHLQTAIALEPTWSWARSLLAEIDARTPGKTAPDEATLAQDS